MPGQGGATFTIKLGTENYSVTKQQLEDIQKTVKSLGLTMKQASQDARLLRSIITGVGGVPGAAGGPVADIFGTGAKASSGLTHAGYGGGEFPIEKFADKFGAANRQMRQAMGELRPALAQYKRDLIQAFSGMEWAFPHTGGKAPIQHILQYSDAELRKGAQQALAMGPLRTGFPVGGAAIGGLASIFSPWIGSRILNQAFGGFPIGGGGEGNGGGLRNALFGGSVPGFGEWFIFISALRMASRVLTDEFVAAIKRGSELYRRAAATGTSTSRLAQIEAILTGIGMDPNMAKQMILQRQSGRGGRFTNVYGEMLRGAQRGGMGIGEIQQIINMRHEIEFLGRAMAFSTPRIAASSRAMNRISMDFSVFKSDWAALWADLVRSMEPAIRGLLILGSGLARLGDIMIRGVVAELVGTDKKGNLPEWVKKLFPSEGPGNRKIGAAGSISRPEHMWERMGLIIHGGLGGSDYARLSAEYLREIRDHFRQGKGNYELPRGAGGAMNIY